MEKKIHENEIFEYFLCSEGLAYWPEVTPKDKRVSLVLDDCEVDEATGDSYDYFIFMNIFTEEVYVVIIELRFDKKEVAGTTYYLQFPRDVILGTPGEWEVFDQFAAPLP